MAGLPLPDLIDDGEAIRSRQFDDIYFQPADGAAESRHVFVNGNKLAERFAALPPHTTFTIAELGFGSGLNFLVAMQAFAAHAPPCAQLHYWSAEGFPLPAPTMNVMLGRLAQRFPELTIFAAALAAAYPTPRPGLAQCRVGPRVTLTLAFGDVGAMLDQSILSADALFLDGFSPAKNPQMWTAAVLSQAVARLRPGGTLATFTVAGTVRRALAEAGVALTRAPGFGRKREMLTGTRGAPVGGATGAAAGSPAPSVTILGAGIAGACLAAMLREAGCAVRVIDPHGVATGASGNLVGLITPRLEVLPSTSARFYRDAFLYACRFYREIAPAALNACGATIVGDAEAVARWHRVKVNDVWAPGDLTIDPGASSLQVSSAATLDPRLAISALLEGVDVESSMSPLDGVSALDAVAQNTDVVVICAGIGARAFLPYKDDIQASRGQIDYFAGPRPDSIISGDGYIAPLRDGFVAGATYGAWPDLSAPVLQAADTEQNAQTAARLGGGTQATWFGARVSLRATTRDRHPIFGALNARTFIIGGLGSRGLTCAPILAAAMRAILCGGASPIEAGVGHALRPDRFAARRARRQETG